MHILARTAHRDDVEALARGGALTPPARAAAIRWIRTRLEWATWIDRLLLVSGSGLVLAGILYFFAFNWAAMPAFAKFGLIEIALAGAVVGTVRAGLDRPLGRVLMMSSAVLVGVLLAVFGQVYQTGADAWQLFGGWAALIAGWVAVGRSQPLAALWVLLLDLTLVQWLSTQHFPWFVRETVMGTSLGVLNAALLGLAEWGAYDGVEWLQGRRWRRALWASVLLSLTCPAFWYVVDLRSHVSQLAGVLAWGGALVAGYVHYAYRSPDVTSLSFGSMSFGLIVVVWLWEKLWQTMGRTEALLFVAFGAVVVAGLLALWLKHVSDGLEVRDE